MVHRGCLPWMNPNSLLFGTRSNSFMLPFICILAWSAESLRPSNGHPELEGPVWSWTWTPPPTSCGLVLPGCLTAIPQASYLAIWVKNPALTCSGAGPAVPT